MGKKRKGENVDTGGVKDVTWQCNARRCAQIVKGRGSGWCAISHIAVQPCTFIAQTQERGRPSPHPPLPPFVCSLACVHERDASGVVPRTCILHPAGVQTRPHKQGQGSCAHTL